MISNDSTEPVSRRDFFQRAVSASAAGAVTSQAPQPPARAWIIMAIYWQYNDEFSFEEGETACSNVYFDEQEAQTTCRKLCEEFFSESPDEFGVRWDIYEVDPDTATWDDLRQAGFPDPYYVKELTT